MRAKIKEEICVSSKIIKLFKDFEFYAIVVGEEKSLEDISKWL